MQIVEIFIKEIFELHEIPKTFVLNCDAKFASNFWKTLFIGMDMKLNLSTSYHSQTYGEAKLEK